MAIPRATSKIGAQAIPALLILAGVLAHPVRLAAQKTSNAEDRDAWQHPAEVMDALGIKLGSVVADVGCGRGYFTFHLASRVGPEGKVYAEEIDPEVLEKVRSRVSEMHMAQIQPILGSPDDPRLPAETLDAILVVDAYHEMGKYDAMLKGMYRALKPGGLLGIIDRKAQPGQPRSSYFEHHQIPQKLVLEDVTRNGFRLQHNEPGFQPPDGSREYFFLVFEKPRANHSTRDPLL